MVDSAHLRCCLRGSGGFGGRLGISSIPVLPTSFSSHEPIHWRLAVRSARTPITHGTRLHSCPRPVAHGFHRLAMRWARRQPRTHRPCTSARRSLASVGPRPRGASASAAPMVATCEDTHARTSTRRHSHSSCPSVRGGRIARRPQIACHAHFNAAAGARGTSLPSSLVAHVRLERQRSRSDPGLRSRARSCRLGAALVASVPFATCAHAYGRTSSRLVGMVVVPARRQATRGNYDARCRVMARRRWLQTSDAGSLSVPRLAMDAAGSHRASARA